MDTSQIIEIINTSPSIKLLRSRSLPFFSTFVTSVFEDETVVPQERLYMLLEHELDEKGEELIEDDQSVETLRESNEQKTKRLIKEWADRGYLTNYQNEEGVIMYEQSSHTSKVLVFIENLKKEKYIGTDSKLMTLFSQLKDLVENSNEDREERKRVLLEKKMEIEHQLQRLEAGENVEVYDEHQIGPRYKDLTKLAKELLSDFNEVDDNFREIIKEIYQRQVGEVQKKELLNYIFDAYGELKESQQGKSFYAFFDFLCSNEMQSDWDKLTHSLYEVMESRGIEVDDLFLKDLKRHLYRAGEKVYKTNDRMSEKLSRIIRYNAQSKSDATRQILQEIKKALIEKGKQHERTDVSLTYETQKSILLLERPISLKKKEETIYDDIPKNAVLGVNDLERLASLYNPWYVDKSLLKERIDTILQEKSQTTLGDVIAHYNGVQKGLTEVLGYVMMAKDYHTIVNEERVQEITFSENKAIIIPEIIITR